MKKHGEREIIEHNARAHDQVASTYEAIHGEIFNPIEQERLAETVSLAVGSIEPAIDRPLALDFGCGTGNLTRHLLKAGCDVIAADVSDRCLEITQSFGSGSSVRPMKLNGRDLSELSDKSVDIVATYSVLHHIPDYLAAVREFARVVRPGGIIYIDHEHSRSYWAAPREFEAVRRGMTEWRQRYVKYLKPMNYRTGFIRKFVDPRYAPEGDIHVYPDDHIEWDLIVQTLGNEGVSVVRSEEYLSFKRGYRTDAYLQMKDKWQDMQYLIGNRVAG